MSPKHEDGDWEIDESRGFAEVVAYNEGGHNSTRVSVADIIEALSDEKRRDLFSMYCRGCGTANLPCPCERDE